LEIGQEWNERGAKVRMENGERKETKKEKMEGEGKNVTG
jgi:hypothetical protein